MDYKKLGITLDTVSQLRLIVFGKRYKAKSALLTKREIRKIEKFIDQVADSDFLIRDFKDRCL